jgi:hypothetical protein
MLAVAVALVTLSAPAAADGPNPPRPHTVSDDGKLVSEDYLPAPPAGLLFRADEVPLPATPDWTADSVRAIGGLKCADVDGDGDLDLVLGCYQQTGFPPVNEYQNMIHFNAGGTLETSAGWIGATERHTSDVRVADVNNDGYPDLYFANGGSSLQPSEVHFGGPGGPPTTPDWTASDATWSVGGTFADVDGDGNVDLIQANQGNTINPFRPVQVFYGDGTTLEVNPTWQSADSAISNTAAAVDLDGGSEVAVTDHTLAGDGSRRVFQLPHASLVSVDRVQVVGGGTPLFTVDREAGFIHFESAPAGGTTIEVDYTYPQYPDLCFSRWVNFETCVYHSNAGTLPSDPTWGTGNTDSDRGIMFSDVDGDGDLDAALGKASAQTELWDNAAGTLTGPVWLADSTLFFSTQDQAWGDVDSDGDEDLATVNFGGGAVRVYLNRNGVMDELPSWTYTLSASGSAICWGDVNGDGRLDLAAGSARGPAIVFLNEGPSGVDAPAVAGGGAMRLSASPNPFDVSTAIAGLAADGGNVEVFDLLGRFVARVPATGGRRAVWDGRDESGARVAAGVYLVRQTADDGIRTGRVVRVR